MCLGVPAAACYSPNQPLVVTAAGDETGGTGDGTADGTSNDAGTADDTAGSTLGASTGSGGGEVESTGEPGEPVCGNGKLEGDEACDDGVNDASYAGCTADCSALGLHCGDGDIQLAAEGCDFGDDQPSSSCNSVCQIPGTILDSTSESPSTGKSSGSVQGIRVVEQDEELVAVFGGDASTYWRIDPDTLGTNDLATTDGDVAFRNVAGLVDLGDGSLLVAGGEVPNPDPLPSRSTPSCRCNGPGVSRPFPCPIDASSVLHGLQTVRCLVVSI